MIFMNIRSAVVECNDQLKSVGIPFQKCSEVSSPNTFSNTSVSLWILVPVMIMLLVFELRYFLLQQLDFITFAPIVYSHCYQLAF